MYCLYTHIRFYDDIRAEIYFMSRRAMNRELWKLICKETHSFNRNNPYDSQVISRNSLILTKRICPVMEGEGISFISINRISYSNN